METFAKIVSNINTVLWGPWLLVLLAGVHIYMTFRTGFIQRKLGAGIKYSVTKDTEGKGDISQFGALTMALASTIGTGNIIGVSTAIVAGGAGAIFWMWIIGVFGIATKYAEPYIAIKYRVKTQQGTMLGGAMFALERGLKMRWLGAIFAFLVMIAALGTGDSVQSNAVASLFYDNFGTPTWIPGIIMTVLTAIALIGGIKWVTRACEKLVPVMAVLYVLGCIVILIVQRQYVVPALVEIVRSAFNASALKGGAIGFTVREAIRFGVARGLFSNESGMGTAPIVAAAAQTKNPARQALVSMTGAFWATVVVCFMSGIVVVSSLLVNPDIDMRDGAVLVNAAFSQIPYLGKIILTAGIITFAFSTILGWSYYGEKGAEYLLGAKAIVPYRVVYTIVVFLGCTVPLQLVWNIADSLNALMVVPNLIAVLLLSNVVSKETTYWLTGNNIEMVDTEQIPLLETLRKKTFNLEK